MKPRILPILMAPVLALGLTRSHPLAIESPVVAVATVRYLAQNLPEIEEIEEIGDRIKRLLETRECRGCDLAGVNLRGADLSGVNLHEVNLENADLREADLTNALIRNTNLKNARLDCAKLDFAFIEASDFSGANLSYASLYGVEFSNTQFIKADLRHANLSHAIGEGNFNGARLNFSKMDFSGMSGNRKNADFSHASLYGSRLYGEFPKANLSYTNLAYTNLEYIRFQGTNLNNSNLIGANLKRARLTNTNLHDIKINHSTLLSIQGLEQSLKTIFYRKGATISRIRNNIFEILIKQNLLKVKVYYDLGHEGYTYPGTLQISYNDEILLEDKMGFYSDDIDPNRGNLRILNLDEDSDLEIILHYDYVGGMRCCFLTRIYDRDPQSGKYIMFYDRINISGEGSYHINDLDRDGRIEFEGVDPDLAYYIRDNGFQVSAPIQILHYQDGETINVTRNYPEHIIPQVHYYWHQLKLAEEGKRIEGIIEMYMAVQYLLGNEKEGWQKVEQYLLSNDQEKWKQIEQLYKKSRNKIDFSKFKISIHDFLHRKGYATSPTLAE